MDVDYKSDDGASLKIQLKDPKEEKAKEGPTLEQSAGPLQASVSKDKAVLAIGVEEKVLGATAKASTGLQVKAKPDSAPSEVYSNGTPEGADLRAVVNASIPVPTKDGMRVLDVAVESKPLIPKLAGGFSDPNVVAAEKRNIKAAGTDEFLEKKPEPVKAPDLPAYIAKQSVSDSAMVVSNPHLGSVQAWKDQVEALRQKFAAQGKSLELVVTDEEVRIRESGIDEADRKTIMREFPYAVYRMGTDKWVGPTPDKSAALRSDGLPLNDNQALKAQLLVDPGIFYDAVLEFTKGSSSMTNEEWNSHCEHYAENMAELGGPIYLKSAAGNKVYFGLERARGDYLAMFLDEGTPDDYFCLSRPHYTTMTPVGHATKGDRGHGPSG